MLIVYITINSLCSQAVDHAAVFIQKQLLYNTAVFIWVDATTSFAYNVVSKATEET